MTPSKFPLALTMAAGLMALGAAGAAQAQEEQGRVISSTPVIQQVALPRQVCQDEQVSVQGQKSGAGAVMGGIAGGAIGNAIGNGSGRAAATVIGLMGGAILGDRIEGGSPSRVETVRNCGTQTFYENQTVAYDVVYEYAGRQYRTQMAQDPGRFVRLAVSPVDALPDPRTAAPAPRVVYQQPEVVYQQPQVIYQAPVTRFIVGREFVPHYPAAPSVVYINGVRQAPGYQGHTRPWRDGDRHESNRPRYDRDGDGRPDKWERPEKWQRH